MSDTPIGSPAFQTADAFTAGHEGGYTANDLGSPANYGINQAAHPEVDVKALTPQGAQRIRYEYWKSIGGDQLAQSNPGLATAAYDTAIMAGPAKAKQLLAQSGGDPATFVQLRSNYLNGLAATDPAKYESVAQNWTARTDMLSKTIGAAPQTPQAAPAAAAPAAQEPGAALAGELAHAAQSGAAHPGVPVKSPGPTQLAAHPAAPLAARSQQQVYDALMQSRQQILKSPTETPA